MGGLFHNLFANRSLFFNLLDQAAKNVVDMAKLLTSVINIETADEREAVFKQMDKMKITGDDITHKICLCLDKVVFTPLNRNDIHALASAIEDVADMIHEASGRMHLYDIDEFAPSIKEIAAIILKASLQIEQAVALLKSSKKADELLGLCLQIKNYERQSGLLYNHAVAGLFDREKDAIKLIKYREILSSLETSVNKCKNVTDVLNIILIKG